MADVDNRMRLRFSIAYAQLAERGIISEADLEKVGALIDSLAEVEISDLKAALGTLGKTSQHPGAKH